jgi:hypothetical protein
MDVARFDRPEPNLVHAGYQGGIQPGAYQPDVYQPGAFPRPTPIPLPAPLVGTSSTTGKYHYRVKRSKSLLNTHTAVYQAPTLLTCCGCSLSLLSLLEFGIIRWRFTGHFLWRTKGPLTRGICRRKLEHQTSCPMIFKVQSPMGWFMGSVRSVLGSMNRAISRFMDPRGMPCRELQKAAILIRYSR